MVVGALSAEPDPRLTLERCKELLRPGGTLLATFPALPLGPRATRGFTEVSVRLLLAGLSPAGAVEVTTYGNLFSLLASVADLPAERLASEDLARVDPDYPVLLAARATMPGKRRLRRSTKIQRRDGRGRAPVAPPHGDRGVVLMYHRVADLPPDGAGICIDPDDFRMHMSILASTCTPLGLTDLVTRAYEQRLPPRPVALTFDDGYLDNLLMASPVLASLGIPATFFVNSVGLEAPAEAWWDSVERIVLVEPQVPERLEFTVAGTTLDMPTITPEDRRRVFSELRRLAMPAPPEAREELVTRLGEWHGLDAAPRSTHRLMNSDEVSQLAGREGHEIGAHTANHLMPTRHAVDVRRREMSENRADSRGDHRWNPSRRFLTHTETAIFSRSTWRTTSGFETAVTVDPGVVDRRQRSAAPSAIGRRQG